MKCWRIWATLMVATGASGAPAQDGKTNPIITDRPDFAESTETIPPGRVQLESGYTFARSGEDTEQTLGQLLLRVGTGSRTELRVGVNSFAQTRNADGRTSGFEDIALGFKFRLSEGSERPGLRQPSVALLAQTSLPTGASAYRQNDLQPEAVLALGWDLSDRQGLAVNLGYAYGSEDDTRFNEFFGAISISHALTDRTGLFLEYFGSFPDRSVFSDTHIVDGGVTYLVNQDYQLDTSVGIGFNGVRPDYFAGLGVSRRW